MTPADLAALERGPGGVEDFLGEPPDLDPADSTLLEFYWRARRQTPSDQPVGLQDALRLFTQVYGDMDALWLLDAIAAMDSEFSKWRSEQIEKSSIGKSKGG